MRVSSKDSTEQITCKTNIFVYNDFALFHNTIQTTIVQYHKLYISVDGTINTIKYTAIVVLYYKVMIKGQNKPKMKEVLA